MGKSTEAKEFIAFDGEGTAQPELPVSHGRNYYRWEGSRKFFHDYEHQPQPYVLLANSKDMRITNKDGLSTVECLRFILNTKRLYPNSIFVGFGFNYDINQMLKDIPENQKERLHTENRARVSGYGVKWFPRKSFLVMNHRTHENAIIYDVFNHFQSSFIKACEKYLGKDDPELDIIRRGKEARDIFSWDELDDFIIPYNNTELSMLVRVMNILRKDYEAVDLVPGQWYGPGAIVRKAFQQHGIKINRDLPRKVLDASQSAYAGGRFEQFKMGRYEGTVYQYDLHSAYPAAAVRLPDISDGTWDATTSFQPGTFGVWYIDYSEEHEKGYVSNRPQPLFCRSELGLISFPSKVRGWYWTPEAELVSPYVQRGYVFKANTDHRPFGFIEAMYDQRRLLKSQGSSSERALKLCLNSCYGKLCQTIASEDGPPRWHQLEYAGYITSYVRAQLYKALLLEPDAAIAVETDAIISTLPLALPLSDNLGDWEEKTYDEITYLQSGFYYTLKDGVLDVKYRGMDRAREGNWPAGLPYDFVLDFLRNNTGVTDAKLAALPCNTTRFVGLGLALSTSSVWCSWEKKRKQIVLDEPPVGPRKGLSKRAHVREACAWCEDGVTMYDAMHDLYIGGHSGLSYARDLPWREVDDQVRPPLDWQKWYAIWEDSNYPHGGLER